MQGQLPTDFGLQRNVTLFVVDGHHVQRAARAPWKVGAIQKDARVLHELGDDLAVLLHPRGAVLALGFELPLVGGEPFRGLFDASLVFFVDEVRAVTTTALDELGRRSGEYAWQPLPKMHVQLLSRKVTSNIQVRSRLVS